MIFYKCEDLLNFLVTFAYTRNEKREELEQNKNSFKSPQQDTL